MDIITFRFTLFLLAAAFLPPVCVAPALAEQVTASYLYNLSDFDGAIPYNGARTFVDEPHGETYVVSSGGVDIYNPSGMQVFHFDYDRELGGVYDASVDENGHILLLTNREGVYRIVRCNYRGEPFAAVDLKHLPPGFEGFRPGRMVCRNGKIYLVSQGDMDAVVLDRDASFMRGYDFATLLGLSEGQKAGSDIGGFTVDRDGNMLFVIGAFGRAYRGLPDGTLTEFGRRGSGAGKFGVPGGIAADRVGNLLITDKLRGVVIIFDKEFRFINEFGYRGTRPGNLIVPGEITVDTVTNRVYVSQLRRRGVNIYQLEYGEEPAR
ncbi:MAG: hypothetical protein WA140_10725 [Geobacteraceae bacterium]